MKKINNIIQIHFSQAKREKKVVKNKKKKKTWKIAIANVICIVPIGSTWIRISCDLSAFPHGKMFKHLSRVIFFPLFIFLFVCFRCENWISKIVEMQKTLNQLRITSRKLVMVLQLKGISIHLNGVCVCVCVPRTGLIIAHWSLVSSTFFLNFLQLEITKYPIRPRKMYSIYKTKES